MSVESIMEMCAKLGIKLALKETDNDRLQVDAPKGALTPQIRETLAENKAAIVANLKSKQLSDNAQPQTAAKQPTQSPASTTSNSPEATPLILEQPSTHTAGQVDRTEIEVNKLLSGNDYDRAVIDSQNPATRQNVSAQLLAALTGR